MYKLEKLSPIECDNCDLCINNRFTPVRPIGNLSKVMIVLEAPGSNEFKRGIGYTGPSGKLVTSLLREYNVAKYCYLTYAVKCFPPMARTPEDDEVNSCRVHLQHEITELKPRIIVLLGRIAVQSLIVKDFSLLVKPSVHKTPNDNYFLISYHPAYSLRYSDTMPEFRETFHMLSVMVHDLLNPLNDIV